MPATKKLTIAALPGRTVSARAIAAATRRNTFAATVTIAVLALGVTACKSSSHASAPAATNAPATQTQADDTSSPSAAGSPSTSASVNPASASPAASSAPASSAPAAAGGELNACSLLTGAQASSLTGHQLDAGTASTLAPGQDACHYSGGGYDLRVTVYQPSSGVSWATMQRVLSGAGTVTQVPGVGDKAMFGGIELDVATGKWLVAIQGADDKVGQDASAIAIGKELVGALASK
jgi:hypothetical protein